MKLNVSLHDVHPGNFELYDKYINKLSNLGIPKVSILVVPFWHKQYKMHDYPDFTDWLQKMQTNGHEILLHSLYHIDEHKKYKTIKDYLTAKLYTAGEGEFFKISTEDAMQKIKKGCNALQQINIHPKGFVAPAWLINENSINALRQLKISYTTTFHGIINIKNNSFIKAPVVVYSSRSPWRRVVSAIWEPIWTKINQKKPVMRVALHPCDLQFHKMEKSITNQIKFLAENRETMTYSEIINKQNLNLKQNYNQITERSNNAKDQHN